MGCGPQAGPRGTDGNKKVRGIKRPVLTCSLGFVPASLVTAANVHDTQAAGVLLGRTAQAGRQLERITVDGISIGARIEATFFPQTNRYRPLTRNLGHSPAAMEEAIDIAN